MKTVGIMTSFAFTFALALLLVGSVGTASANGAGHGNPAQTCGADNAFPTDFGPLPIPSRGGCASSVATGELSHAAYVARCQEIRATDPESFYGAFHVPTETEPFYGFGGTINSCAGLLEALHTGGA